MQSFQEWLDEEHPECDEGRITNWIAKKGLPLAKKLGPPALNAYLAVTDPYTQVIRHNPMRYMNQGSRQASADDYFAQQQSDELRAKVDKGKIGFRRRRKPLDNPYNNPEIN